MALAMRVLGVLGNFVGCLMFFMGIIWALQGLGLLPGALMHGDLKWTYIGVPMSLVGLGLIAFLNRGPRAA